MDEPIANLFYGFGLLWFLTLGILSVYCDFFGDVDVAFGLGDDGYLFGCEHLLLFEVVDEGDVSIYLSTHIHPMNILNELTHMPNGLPNGLDGGPIVGEFHFDIKLMAFMIWVIFNYIFHLGGVGYLHIQPIYIRMTNITIESIELTW